MCIHPSAAQMACSTMHRRVCACRSRWCSRCKAGRRRRTSGAAAGTAMAAAAAAAAAAVAATGRRTAAAGAAVAAAAAGRGAGAAARPATRARAPRAGDAAAPTAAARREAAAHLPGPRCTRSPHHLLVYVLYSLGECGGEHAALEGVPQAIAAEVACICLEPPVVHALACLLAGAAARL